MKILHLIVLRKLPVGVLNQLRDEVAAAASIRNVQWQTKVFTTQCPEPESFVHLVEPSPRTNVYGTMQTRWRLERALKVWLQDYAHEYDLILLRFEKGNPFQYWRFRNVPNLLTVHHTFEVAEIAHLRDGLTPFRVATETHLSARLLRSVVGVVGVTPEIVDYELARGARAGIHTFVWPNGIAVGRVALSDDRRGGVIKLVGAASAFMPWHGLDRLLDALENYSGAIELHLAGRVDDALAKRCRADTRVKMHGLLDRKALDDLMAECDLGLGSFAMERNGGMRQGSTLKVREYLASGVPVYSGCMDSGLPDSFPFYRYGDADFKLMVELAQQYRDSTRAEIRNAAQPHIEKHSVMQRFADELLLAYGAKASSR